ncbi:hypothetical protein KDM41_17115, partial [bacterium]|nr:hypothetical protein [bacterium]
AGALAFGWSGSLRPIAGVTPAAEMLALPATRPATDWREAALGTGGGVDELAGLVPVGVDRELARDLETDTAAVPAPDGGAPAARGDWPDAAGMWRRLATDLAGAQPGFDPNATGWLLHPMGAAGAGTAVRSGALVPGGACAVPLVTGDASLGAIGTVTWVDGDRVLMMGHPFMQRGPVNLPLATAEIQTILPSREMSFKMGSVGALVGAVHHDQRAGLAGRLGPVPALIPVRVQVGGAGGAVHEFAVADDPLLTPTLVFWAVYNSLLVAGDDASLQNLAYTVRTTWEGEAGLAARPLELRGVTAGPGGAAGVAREIMGPLTALLNNAHAPLRLTAVEATWEVRRPLRTARVSGLAGPRTVARAGDEVTFAVELDVRDGGPDVEEFHVVLPRHLAPGPYRVVAASAADLFGLEAQRAPGRFQPTNLPGMIELLRTERSGDVLALAILAPGTSLVVEGRELANLPESIAETVQAGNLGVQRSLADYVLRMDRRLEHLVVGHAVRHLEIKATPAPVGEERRP